MNLFLDMFDAVGVSSFYDSFTMLEDLIEIASQLNFKGFFIWLSKIFNGITTDPGYRIFSTIVIMTPVNIRKICIIVIIRRVIDKTMSFHTNTDPMVFLVFRLKIFT